MFEFVRKWAAKLPNPFAVAVIPECARAPVTVSIALDQVGGSFVWLVDDDNRAAIVCEKWPSDIPSEHLRNAKGTGPGRVLLRRYALTGAEMAKPLGELARLYPRLPNAGERLLDHH